MQRIGNNGQPDRREVNPNLVRPSRQGLDFQQAITPERLNLPVPALGGSFHNDSTGPHRNGRADFPVGPTAETPTERHIGLFDLPVFEKHRQRGVSPCVLCEHEQPARLPVDPVDDEYLPQVRAESFVQIWQGSVKTVRQDKKAGGLVDDEQVLIFIGGTRFVGAEEPVEPAFHGQDVSRPQTADTGRAGR